MAGLRRRFATATTPAEYNEADTEATLEIVTAAEVRLKLIAIEKQLNDTFVRRQDAIRVILLGVLAQQNFLLVGPPGTAKTAVIDRFVSHVESEVRFKILMGRFTQPEHVFGVLDISEFKAGRYTTVTRGMLPEAPLPILDEALKASDGCMNSLLGVLGPEREFQSKRTKNLCIGAATNWPEVDTLHKNVEALYDRFLLRCVVTAVPRTKMGANGQEVPDPDLRRELYRAASKVEKYEPEIKVTVDELKLAHSDAMAVHMADPILDALDDLIMRLVAPVGSGNSKVPSDLEISDRRATQLQSVLKANAWLEGRPQVGIEDFDVLRHGLWAKHKQVDKVSVILDSIDTAAVQRLQQMIDKGRAAYRTLSQSGFNPAKFPAAIEEITNVAREVKRVMSVPTFTKKGRTMVGAAMAQLEADYKDICKRVNEINAKP